MGAERTLLAGGLLVFVYAILYVVLPIKAGAAPLIPTIILVCGSLLTVCAMLRLMGEEDY